MDFLSTFLNVLIIVVLAIPGYSSESEVIPRNGGEYSGGIAFIHFSAVSDDVIAAE